MSYNYPLKYKKFSQLLSEVAVDFQNYDLENYIQPEQLIKVAKRVNYDLGLRIAMTKEGLLEIEKGRVKLPDNFYILNYAMICDEGSVHSIFPSGTHIEEKLITPYKETSAFISPCTDGTVNCQQCQTQVCGCGSCNTCNPTPCGCSTPQVPTACSAGPYNPLIPFGDSCVKPRVFINCKGDSYELVQIINSVQTNHYKILLPLKMMENAQDIECGCPNLYMNCEAQGWIKDGFLFTTFKTGKVYINYQAMMEDDEGNLLVPDHDMINEYYEYSIKDRILENLIMNDETVSQMKVQLIKDGLKKSRNYALSIVNTPNFSEMKAVWQMNRNMMYNRYYNMFKGQPWYPQDRYSNGYSQKMLNR